MASKVSNRIRFIAIAVVLVFLLFVVRLGYLQIIHGADYREEANRQYMAPGTSGFDRGSIYMTEKGGSLISAATVKPDYFVSVNPSKVKDPKQLYKTLKQYMKEEETSFLNKFSDTKDTYEVIIKNLDEKSAASLAELKNKDIQIHKTQVRDYPTQKLAAQTIGFVGLSKETGDDLVGRAGLELYYDEVLSREVKKLYVNFFAELFGDLASTLFDRKEAREGEVVLTIEPHVELELEKSLAEVKKTYSGKEVGGIIMDPKTGEILAMSSLPTFDPNDYRNSDPNTFTNPLVQSVYEMGSIVKPLTMAAGLDTGAVKPETTYKDEGQLKFGEFTIKNFDGKGRGVVPMQEILNQSLNTGAVFVMQQLGAKRFERYLHNYGFGDVTGIDLPSESAGLINTIDSGRPVELATAAFGQGFAVTPITMTRALASLGNGGLIVRPHVTKTIKYAYAQNDEKKTIVERRVIDEETSKTITRMLVQVVDKALAKGTMKMEHYSIAAKTGTAQIPIPGGGYYPDKYLHSFFGYAPAYDPRFIVFLYIKEPQGVKYASETLTKPFFDLTKFLLHYYEVPPDR